MNATSSSPLDLMEDIGNGSDSDTNHDISEYYQPISEADDENSDQTSSEDENHSSDPRSQHLPNGYSVNRAENGISSLGLNDEVEWKSSEEEEEEVAEEQMGDVTDSAIRRAFREDENRRNAPLNPENATRVMEAMRGISFEGVAPDWAQRVPEHHWIDQLRRLRQSPSSVRN